MRVLLAISLALVILAAPPLVGSFLITAEGLDAGELGWVPPCPSRLAGTRCGLCGMTHALAAMSSGEWEAARTYNPNGPTLYIGLWCCLTLGGLGVALSWRARAGPPPP